MSAPGSDTDDPIQKMDREPLCSGRWRSSPRPPLLARCFASLLNYELALHLLEGHGPLVDDPEGVGALAHRMEAHPEGQVQPFAFQFRYVPALHVEIGLRVLDRFCRVSDAD